ncbi:MAG: Uncharacterized protein FD123_3527 [Bacteroidetes bacterium]|nr:MAG: Uncharacterized protein FD123_3527 [Bacteroidota bacterium]
MHKLTLGIIAVFCFALSSELSAITTFTSTGATTPWNSTTSWSQSGLPVDADGIPDSNDDVVIAAGTTIGLNTNGFCRTMTIAGTGAFNLNGFYVSVYGTFTNGGSINYNGTIYINATSTFTSTVAFPSFTGNISLVFQTGTISIAAGSLIGSAAIPIYYFSVGPGVTVNNSGTINSNNIFNIAGTFNMLTGSSVTLTKSISGSGTINSVSGPNTVTMNGNAYTTIKAGTYHHLVLNGTGSTIYNRVFGGTMNINGNITMNSSAVRLNWNNNSLNLAGNWTNNSNVTGVSIGTIDFTGTGAQTVTRSSTETFNNFNVSGSGTVTLARDILCTGDVKLTGGILDVSASNFGINVRGNWTNSATFDARQGTVTFSRTAAPVQQIDGSSITAFYNITSSNSGPGVEVVAPATLDNLLTVTTGLFGTSGTGTLTLNAAGATSYARIGTVSGSLTGTGWIIQSYIDGPASAYWQYLSSPINGNILSDWDNDTRFYMSAVGGNDGTACCPTFFSVRTYNEPTNTYSNVTTTATALTPGRGFMIWMSDNLSGLTAPLIYDSRGIPSFSTKTFPITAGGSGGGYNLVGNPYACPVTYSAVVTASGNLGASFLVLSESGSYVTNPNGGVIAPNQGFLCPATSSGVITFTEACKNTTALPNIIRIGDPENFIRINIRSVMNGLGGQAVVNFDPNSTRNNDIGIDLPFIESPYELAANIWTKGADNSELLMNVDPAQEDEITIPLFVEPAVFGQHDLTFEGLNAVNTYSCATLEDPSTGEIIDLGKQSKYSFIVNSTGKKTFLLHFKRTPDGCRLADQAMAANLEAQTSVYANANGLFAKFGFSEATDIRLSVFNMLGQEIIADKQAIVQNETLLLDVPESHGIYLVRVQMGDKEITKKIFY